MINDVKRKRGYGTELILDIYNCDVVKFTRENIEAYLIELCDNVIDMKRAGLQWWDYEGEPEEYAKAPNHLKGISCIQFMTTSNITIHTLDVPKSILINIFSCKEFSKEEAVKFTVAYFGGDKTAKNFQYNYQIITRGEHINV